MLIVMSHEKKREREREREKEGEREREREKKRDIPNNNNKLISLQVIEFDLHRSASLNNKFKAKEGHGNGEITN